MIVSSISMLLALMASKKSLSILLNLKTKYVKQDWKGFQSSQLRRISIISTLQCLHGLQHVKTEVQNCAFFVILVYVLVNVRGCGGQPLSKLKIDSNFKKTANPMDSSYWYSSFWASKFWQTIIKQ